MGVRQHMQLRSWLLLNLQKDAKTKREEEQTAFYSHSTLLRGEEN